ncbi:MAG: hypothetical protein JNL97_11090 [Verrucomicrobiales bacterium]|nr:hypothetical protein [Verrucomicrobiales bacterium]
MPNSYPATYQATDAALVQDLASVASGDIRPVSFLPGWQVIAKIPGEADDLLGFAILVAKRTLPSFPDRPAVVMAVGQAWSDFLGNYNAAQDGPGDFGLSPLDDVLGGASAGAAAFCGAFQTQYVKRVEKRLFRALSGGEVQRWVNDLPLIVTGQGLGAPLAQLIALAFRRGRSDLPTGLRCVTSACYTFSTPPMGNAAFSTFFRQTVPAAFEVRAERIDGFAMPASNPPAVAAGNVQGLTRNAPEIDDPWVERGATFYASLLGHDAHPPTMPGGIGNPPPPEGFRGELAQTLARLCAVTYQQAQHPDLPPSPNLPSYVLDSKVSAKGTLWACLFVDAPNTRVVAAFRGSIGFAETTSLVTPVGNANPDYLPYGSSVGSGFDAVYAGLRATFRTLLAAALAKAGTGSSLLLAGHGEGGVLANIAALDLAGSPVPGLAAVGAIYTFGSPPSGNDVFRRHFEAGYPANSFQLVRQRDPFPQLTPFGGPYAPGLTLELIGATTADDHLDHSLTSFVELLRTI